MIRTTLRSRWRALAIASVALGLAPGVARGEQQQPPPGPPPPYQPPPPPATPYVPPPGAPGYGPPAYGAPPVSAPIFAPEEITDFDDSQPVPYGYTRVSRARKGLIIGGAVTLGATYAVTAFIGAVAADINKADGSNADVTALYIPAVGPFLELGQTDSSIARFYLTLSGLGQTAGAVMLIVGLTSPRTVLVRNDRLSITHVGPMVARGASGLSVMGRF